MRKPSGDGWKAHCPRAPAPHCTVESNRRSRGLQLGFTVAVITIVVHSDAMPGLPRRGGGGAQNESWCIFDNTRHPLRSTHWR